LRNIPVKNPIKVPIAALKAPFLLLKLTINSPIKAPKKGPKRIPNGPKKKIPIINPIVLPITLPFPPPNFLAAKTGMKLSKRKINKAMQKLKIKKLLSNEIDVAKLKKKIPNQDVIGPGIIGRKLPIIPSRIKIPATTISNRSI
tara:strand:+ start:857 stop:1288 length:432 start_codon:yes stop_codon:yes gene_type:complete